MQCVGKVQLNTFLVDCIINCVLRELCVYELNCLNVTNKLYIDPPKIKILLVHSVCVEV